MKRDTVRKTDNFESSANKTMAKNLRGHLMLMHGDMDDNVHPANTIQLIDELIKANKIVRPDHRAEPQSRTQRAVLHSAALGLLRAVFDGRDAAGELRDRETRSTWTSARKSEPIAVPLSDTQAS